MLSAVLFSQEKKLIKENSAYFLIPSCWDRWTHTFTHANYNYYVCTTAHKQNNVLLALTLRSLLFSRKSLLLLVHPHVLSIHHHHRRHFLVPYIQHLLFFIRRVSSYNLTYLTRVSHHYVTTTCPFPFFDALCEGMLTHGRTNSTHGFTTKKANQKTKKTRRHDQNITCYCWQSPMW